MSIRYSIRRFLAAAALLLPALSCTRDRDSLLKIYNWGDYIDESLLPEFESWYESQTGEKVKTVYQTFDINETMLSKIERGREDFDVVCPSDYIIERMLRSDLLLPIDRDFGDTPDWISSNISPFISDWFSRIDGHGKDARDYAAGYMWGTTGILYNTRYVTEEEASTWAVICNPKFSGKIFIKDAARDVFAPMLIYLRQDEIKSGRVTMDELMSDSSDSSLADVERHMKEVKKHIAGWEADFGKELMSQGAGYVNLTWSGDAVWAMEEGRNAGVELDYRVPAEGSAIWFDGWVIPRYARNVKAARYFIDFMCKPENAIRNMEVIGYVSAVCGKEILDHIADNDRYGPVDLTYFFGEGADSVCANPVQYPDRSAVARCVLEHDWGDDTPKLTEMWSRVKGDGISAWTAAILSCVAAALVAATVVKSVHRRHRRLGAGRRLSKRRNKLNTRI